jgi:hypothetical protein
LTSILIFRCGVHDLAPDRSGAPTGGTDRRPGIRASGFEGEGANQGAVSRPKRSGGRVTATDEEGRHECVALTRKED